MGYFFYQNGVNFFYVHSSMEKNNNNKYASVFICLKVLTKIKELSNWKSNCYAIEFLEIAAINKDGINKEFTFIKYFLKTHNSISRIACRIGKN